MNYSKFSHNGVGAASGGELGSGYRKLLHLISNDPIQIEGETQAPMFGGFIEGDTSGPRPAHWIARLWLTASGFFLVEPVGLREIDGKVIGWSVPAPGKPISAPPVRNPNEARRIASMWASRAVAEMRR